MTLNHHDVPLLWILCPQMNNCDTIQMLILDKTYLTLCCIIHLQHLLMFGTSSLIIRIGWVGGGVLRNTCSWVQLLPIPDVATWHLHTLSQISSIMNIQPEQLIKLSNYHLQPTVLKVSISWKCLIVAEKYPENLQKKRMTKAPTSTRAY